jgi:RNA polymerase sigma-70 factor (ECF subfamily)
METTQTSSLEATVRSAQQGVESAQRELIVAYQRRVAGFVYAVTGRSDCVEDLCQLVFIKMVRALSGLQSPAQFEAWLFRLARNVCIDHLRRERLRRIFVPFAAEHTEVAEPVGAVDSEELDALRQVLQEEGAGAPHAHAHARTAAAAAAAPLPAGVGVSMMSSGLKSCLWSGFAPGFPMFG